MKKCMSGCGGKMMSKSGKVSPVKIKKMESGGTAKKGLCPDGYYWTVQGCEKKMPGHKGPLSSTGSKIGVGIPLAGMIGAGVSAISNAIKNKKAKKKEEASAKPAEEIKRRGGAKYKAGGIAKQTIVAFPGYNARTDTMKKGGIKKRAMGGDSNDRGMMDPNSGLKPTTYDPRTVVARKGGAYKKGGAAKNAKLAAVAAPKNKVTRADVLTRILKNKKK